MFWRSFILVILGLVNVVLFSRMVWGPTGLLEYRELKKQYSDSPKAVQSCLLLGQIELQGS